MTARRPPEGKGYDLQGDYTKDADPFWFRWADQWWEIPHLKMLDFEDQVAAMKMQADVESLDDLDAVTETFNALFDLLLGAEQGAEFRQVKRPLPAMMDTLQKWREHSGVTEEQQGESSASGGSSTSTGRPSKRTSKPSTASASRGRSTGRSKAGTARGNSSSASAA